MDTQKLRDLLNKRDELDAEIASTVLGASKQPRAPQTCSLCKSTEHSARKCPQRDTIKT